MDELDEVGTRLGTWFPYPWGVSSSTSAASEAEETCSWQEIWTELLLPHLSFHIIPQYQLTRITQAINS